MSSLEQRITDDLQRSTLTVRTDAGCVACSWIVDGREVLALPSPLAEFLASARTGGIPLLYPYANRLRTEQFNAAHQSVDLSKYSSLKRDGAGFPIHGLLLRWSSWECVNTGSTLEARLDWRVHSEFMHAYPFAHTLRVRWELSHDDEDAILAITTTIEADGGVDVPWAFGWHPYFALESGATLELPARRSIALDSNGLPLLDAPMAMFIDKATVPAQNGQDELFAINPDARGVIATNTRTIAIEFGDEYRWMQVYSPRNAAFASLEPMVAPTSALADGRAESVAAGTARSARFVIRVR